MTYVHFFKKVFFFNAILKVYKYNSSLFKYLKVRFIIDKLIRYKLKIKKKNKSYIASIEQ